MNTHDKGVGDSGITALASVFVRPLEKQRKGRPSGLLKAATLTLGYGYLALLAILLGSIWIGGDRWWWATALMFAPRWPWLTPAVVALPALFFWGHRWLPAVLLLSVTPALVGMRAPVMNLFTSHKNQEVFTIVTINVQGGGADLGRLAESWPAGTDAVVLQETNERVLKELLPEGWNHSVGSAGVCIASPHPMDDVEDLPRPYMPGWGVSAVRSVLHCPRGDIRLVGVHFRTPRDGVEALLSHKLAGAATMQQTIQERQEEAAAVRRWLNDWLNPYDTPLVLAGDFNTPVESRIYQGNWSDLRNAFGFAGCGMGRTKFTKWHGVRIDHILCDSTMQVVRCWVGEEVGSDHRAVFAELAYGNKR